MPRHLNLCFLLLALLASAGPAFASEIYHWVDEQGVNHYSQSPPETQNNVETLEVDGSQPASYDPNEDRYNIAAQEAAMQEMRDKMAESRKNRQQAQPASSDTTVIYYPETEGYSQLLYPPGYGPRPPHVRPLPPDERPGRPGNLPAVTPPASRPFRPR
jgi:hypothetical protein